MRVNQSDYYNPAMGWLDSNMVASATDILQYYDYDVDLTGNVTKREIWFGVNSSANMAETFGYDNLHRLTGRTVTQAFAQISRFSDASSAS